MFTSRGTTECTLRWIIGWQSVRGKVECSGDVRRPRLCRDMRPLTLFVGSSDETSFRVVKALLRVDHSSFSLFTHLRLPTTLRARSRTTNGDSSCTSTKGSPTSRKSRRRLSRKRSVSLGRTKASASFLFTSAYTVRTCSTSPWSIFLVSRRYVLYQSCSRAT